MGFKDYALDNLTGQWQAWSPHFSYVTTDKRVEGPWRPAFENRESWGSRLRVTHEKPKPEPARYGVPTFGDEVEKWGTRLGLQRQRWDTPVLVIVSAANHLCVSLAVSIRQTEEYESGARPKAGPIPQNEAESLRDQDENILKKTMKFHLSPSKIF